jgi:hypothetical protein
LTNSLNCSTDCRGNGLGNMQTLQGAAKT